MAAQRASRKLEFLKPMLLDVTHPQAVAGVDVEAKGDPLVRGGEALA